MAKGHGALLDEIELVLGRHNKGTSPLTPELASDYLRKLEVVMTGEIGDREWGLHEALKAKAGA